MTLNRLLRGGNWNNNSNNCRASKRNNNTPDNINNNIGFRVVSTPRLELRQEIAAGKAKSPGTEPGLPTSSCATRAGESRRSESSSHHRDLGIQPAVVPRRAQLFAHSSSCNALHKHLLWGEIVLWMIHKLGAGGKSAPIRADFLQSEAARAFAAGSCLPR